MNIFEAGQCYEISWPRIDGSHVYMVGKVDRVMDSSFGNGQDIYLISPNYKHDGHWRGDNLGIYLLWNGQSRKLMDATVRHITIGNTFILRGLLPRYTSMDSYYGDINYGKFY